MSVQMCIKNVDMLRRVYLQILLAVIFVALIGTKSSAQFFRPTHKVASVTGKTHFSYNQTPDQLVEIYPATHPNVNRRNEIFGMGVKLVHLVAYYRKTSSGTFEYLFLTRHYNLDGSYKDIEPILDIPTKGPF